MTSPGGIHGGPPRRQKRMGPAPIASFEDLSDEVRSHVESPDEKIDAGSVVRLPGIREDVTPGTPASQGRISPEFVYTGISLVGAPSTPPSAVMSSVSTPPSRTKTSLQTPNTPRIDISRASSSSQHEDSRDSTPERELFEGHDPARAKLGLGFREEGTLDLRSSTEELDFQDPQAKQKSKPPTPGPPEDSTPSHQRKDSQSSEIGMLSISGRTSRLSSIGSQGSTHSRVSNASHLSVISGQSGLSRSPSPHKMLLETSFCGTKPNESSQKSAEKHGTKSDPDDLEKIILARKHDPTKAILAEGITVTTPKITRGPSGAPEKPLRKEMQTVKPSITITVDKPSAITSSNNKARLPKTIIAASGTEYTYIPLKGPLPEDPPGTDPQTKSRVRETRSAPISHRTKPQTKSQSKQPSKPSTRTTQSKTRERPAATSQLHPKQDEPKYIRIKLKPDHMYAADGIRKLSDIQKPDSLDLNDTHLPSEQSEQEIIQMETSSDKVYTAKPIEPQGRSISSTPSASPKFSRHILKEPIGNSKSPSPSLSRKSSFASLFKSREAIISPESPTIPGTRRKSTLSGIIKDAGENLRERRRSRSKSRERDRSNLSVAPSSTESIDSKGKQKSTVLSIFKGKSKPVEKSKHDSDDGIGIGALSNVEFKFRPERCEMSERYHETQLEGDSVRIPLHSPTYYEQKAFLHELRSSSQGSQETVIEANIGRDDKSEDVVAPPDPGPVQKTKVEEIRQNSTSSENIVFTTRLGSSNEIFTTKLPKDKFMDKDVDMTTENVTIIDVTIMKSSTTDTKPPPYEEKLPSSVTSENKIEEVVKNKGAEDKYEEVQETIQHKGAKKRTSKAINDDDHFSSESEKDSEIDFLKEKQHLELQLDARTEPIEIERKGLVLLQDSFEDELPYIPTTLPLERSVAIPIVPIKQRSTYEMKVYPIERPRSTTPINPSCLEDYCEEMVSAVNAETVAKTVEKLKISLPREDSIKSPRRPGSNTNWFEFAEKKVPLRRPSLPPEPETTPPPLPPKGVQKEWINFEEIPEKRKLPKRIQTIPSRGAIDVPESVLHDNVVYSYVNPEDCKCECHEINARARTKESQRRDVTEPTVQEDELPLLHDEQAEDEKPIHENVERIKLDVTILDRRSIISDSSIDLSTSVEPTLEANGVECLHMPFTSDLGVSSNRSSIVSQDEAQTPDGSPNAFPNNS